jgi:hypothetical protein
MVGKVSFSVQIRNYADLESHLDHYQTEGDWVSWGYVQRLLQTAEGRYDFREADLNTAVRRSFRPTDFRTWLQSEWGETEDEE